MTIWQQDSLSAPGKCNGVRDYKLHCPAWRKTQRAGCVENDEDATHEVGPWRKAPSNAIGK